MGVWTHTGRAESGWQTLAGRVGTARRRRCVLEARRAQFWSKRHLSRDYITSDCPAHLQAEARGSLQVLLAIREANPTSELRKWWQGTKYTAWRGVKTQAGEVVELCAPVCGLVVCS